MNNDRRKTIKGVIKVLQTLKDETDSKKVNEVLEQAVNDIESVRSDEESAFENLSEGLQSSRQDSHDEIMEKLSEAVDAIASLDADDDESEDIEDCIEQCVAALEEIN